MVCRAIEMEPQVRFELTVCIKHLAYKASPIDHYGTTAKMAARVGFEPTGVLSELSINSRARLPVSPPSYKINLVGAQRFEL